ncbi:hypothetical protein [Parasitella parasitica]|uniref:Uncharacterized protein n=1 Tax=Parasitella parasitica TaxID=35722 RepID=A0A0B7NRD9_9FUNG|nr:hypothetical protein [Parasitella parasitica]
MKIYPKHKKFRFDGGNSPIDSASFENAAVYISPTVNEGHQEIDATINAAIVTGLPGAAAQDDPLSVIQIDGAEWRHMTSSYKNELTSKEFATIRTRASVHFVK